LLGFFLILEVGPYGAGYLWLFIVPILASIFTNTFITSITIIVNVITLLLAGFLLKENIYPGRVYIPFSMESWIVIISNFTFLEIATSFSIIVITKGLENTLKSEKEISKSLAIKSDELADAMEAVKKADTLKSEFLAQMSHEIRSPINTILSSVSMLKSNSAEINEEEREELFAIIQRGSNRVIRTIDLILNMSELTTGSFQAHFESLNLIDDILKPVISELKHIAENKNISLQLINNSDNNILITADRYSATQIFVNLVDNAIKYTNSGSVNITVNKNGEYISTDVVDTGIGISEEYLKDLFKPFSQEEAGYTRRFEGNGLGLALVQKYCELNGAHVSAQSKKGLGSKFNVLFPCSKN
jgi:signal transduction histidine kinase